jgi:hypothetical protein
MGAKNVARNSKNEINEPTELFEVFFRCARARTHTHTIHTFLTIFLSFFLFSKSLNFRNLRTSLSVVLHTVLRAQHLGMLSGVQMFPTAYETLRCCNYTSANDLEVPNSHAVVLYKVLIISPGFYPTFLPKRKM